MSRFKIDQAGLTESLGGACSTPRMDERGTKNSQKKDKLVAARPAMVP